MDNCNLQAERMISQSQRRRGCACCGCDCQCNSNGEMTCNCLDNPMYCCPWTDDLVEQQHNLCYLYLDFCHNHIVGDCSKKRESNAGKSENKKAKVKRKVKKVNKKTKKRKGKTKKRKGKTKKRKGKTKQTRKPRRYASWKLTPSNQPIDWRG